MPDQYGRMLKEDFVKDGVLPLFHFTRAPMGDAFETDPKEFGKNPWSKAEAKEDPSPKTFFYPDPKYKDQDTGPGGTLYHGSIPADHVYDATHDPEFYAERAPNIRVLLDKLKEKGFKGIYYSGVFPTVALWHPVPLKKAVKETAHQLARVNTSGLANAIGAVGSDSHKKRVDMARQILSEAGVTPAQVKAVLVHDASQSRPAVFAAGHVANDDHARYAAAWIGLVTGAKRMTVFHPGDGPDVLHVLHSSLPVKQVSEYLTRAGVGGFSTDSQGTGTRVYVSDPDDRVDLQSIARGINARYSQLKGRADRIGGGAGSSASTGSGSGDPDARAAFRTVIRAAERRAAGSDATQPADQAP